MGLKAEGEFGSTRCEALCVCVAGLRRSSLGGDKARCCNNYIKSALSPEVLSKITRVRKM